MGEGLLPPIVLELRAKATELKAELGETKKELSELEEHTKGATGGMSGAFTKAAGYGKTLTIGIAGAAVAVGGFAIEAATSAQVVDAKLATAVKNAGGNMEELEPKIGSVDSKLRTLGFTNDQTNTALATMTTALKDPEKAMEAMGVASDLARAKNLDLNTAALMVAKGMEGQTRPLKQLGIDLPVYAGNAQAVRLAQDALAKAQQGVNDVLGKYPDAAKEGAKGHAQYEAATRKAEEAQKKLADTQDSGKQIMEALEERVKGTASAYGDTLAGKVAAGKASVEAMGESLGKKLIPVVVDAMGAAQKFVGWLSEHTPVLYTVAGVIGTVVVLAITAYIVSLVQAGAASVVQFAKMIASAASWAASMAVQTAQSTASFVAWAAQGIAKAVAAAATGFASMVASAAGWVAQQAVQLAESAAGFVAWGVEHAVMAGAFIAENIAMAASATAAFIAENAATLGIGVAIAAVVAAVIWLATHWKEAWSAIQTAAKWAYDNVIRPVGGWIMDNVLRPIGAAAQWLGGVWSSVWNGIGSALQWVYDHTIGPIVNLIKGAIGGVMSAVNGISHAASSVGHFLGFDNGGRVPGAKGAPMLAVVHGGEYVLSNEMQAGRQSVDDGLLAGAASANGFRSTGPGSAPPGAGAGGPTVNVYATTNADPYRIAAETGWALRAMA